MLSACLTNSQIGFLKEEMIKAHFQKSGSYEGFTKDVEDTGNALANYYESGSLFSGEKLLWDKSMVERKKIIPIVKKLIIGMECGTVWLNNWKSVLPINYIDRKVVETRHASLEQPGVSFIDLVINSVEKLALLVDGPEMGKSSGLTKLEGDLRSLREIPQRIIIRINLDLFCRTLKQIPSHTFTLVSFFALFSSCIPLKLLKMKDATDKLPVYILLDGLDEIFPVYRDTIIRILRGLLNSVDAHWSFFVKKVMLTSRPHLKGLIEKEFKVQSLSLCPLKKEEHIGYLFRELKALSKYEVQENLQCLPSQVLDLLSNPFILQIYSGILQIGTLEDYTDLESLYFSFIERKYELYLIKKEKADLAHPITIRRKQHFLSNILTAYNYIAIEQFVSLRSQELRPHYSNSKFLQERLDEIVNRSICLGSVVLEGRKIRFQHRSFAVYFFAIMMMDNMTKAQEITNALFVTEYCGNRESMFSIYLKCKVSKEAIFNVMSSRWMKDLINPTLLSYNEKPRFLLNHLLTNCLEYDKECPMKNHLVVPDWYTFQERAESGE